MRMPRLSLAHVPQHVVVRGNNGEFLFNCPHDGATYLNYLESTTRKFESQVHAFVLMPNHVHLLISSPDPAGVGKTLQALARHYVPYFNSRYQRSGALFAPRYRSALVEHGWHALMVSRYIEKNPVRAAFCHSAADYKWSSVHFNAQGVEEPLLSTHQGYRALSEDDAGRRTAYSKLLSKHLSVSELSQIRTQTNRCRVIGSDAFIATVEEHFGISLAANARGGDRRSERFRARQRLAVVA